MATQSALLDTQPSDVREGENDQTVSQLTQLEAKGEAPLSPSLQTVSVQTEEVEDPPSVALTQTLTTETQTTPTDQIDAACQSRPQVSHSSTQAGSTPTILPPPDVVDFSVLALAVLLRYRDMAELFHDVGVSETQSFLDSEDEGEDEVTLTEVVGAPKVELTHLARAIASKVMVAEAPRIREIIAVRIQESERCVCTLRLQGNPPLFDCIIQGRVFKVLDRLL